MPIKIKAACLIFVVMTLVFLIFVALYLTWSPSVLFMAVSSVLFLVMGLFLVIYSLGKAETRIIKAVLKGRSDASRHEYIQERLLDRLLDRLASTSADVEGLVWMNSPVDDLDVLDFHRREAGSKLKVLFVTSNGAGMGHLTRLMAVARHLDADAAFVSLSSAAPVVRKQGFDVIYIESQSVHGVPWSVWNRTFARRIDSILRGNSVDVVVFDGTWIYRGLSEACYRNDVDLIWSRRGLWKDGADISQSANSRSYCDYVIEPSDVATARDNGPISRFPADAVTEPVTIVDRSEILDVDEARIQLGLSPDKRYVFVQLGAGQINDISVELQQALSSVQRLGPEWQAVIGRSPISKVADADNYSCQVVRKFPIAAHLRAFEFGIVAAGYNTVHEAVIAQLPCIFIPNSFTSTDNQDLRASTMAELGFGLVAKSPGELDAAILKMSGTALRESMIDSMNSNASWQGARQFATVIEDFMSRRTGAK